MNRKPLGRGLASLLSGGDIAAAEAAAGAAIWKGQPTTATVAIESLAPSRNQPRRDFDDQSLRELAASIKEHGVLQPILVAEGSDGGAFEIVAGERRWRAAAIAELSEVPIIILRQTNRDAAQVVSLVENLQRQDLNPMEEAVGYEALVNSFAYTHERVAKKMGKSRSYITNSLRLLELPRTVQRDVALGNLPTAAARLLVGRENAEALARRIKDNKLNVRQVERLVAADRKPPTERSESAARWERMVGEALGMKVRISGGDKGSFTIYYRGLEQLEALVESLSHPLKLKK